jgi:DNA-directed RNA polymerase specialized sigma24 family protein
MSEFARDSYLPSAELTRDAWNRFLRALHPDAAVAASRYEQLRQRLIAMYRLRGLPRPEDLADQAIDRVACHVIRGPNAGADLGAYLRGVAHRIADDATGLGHEVEVGGASELAELAAAPADDGDEPLDQLCRCLDDLPRLDRNTLLEYEMGSGFERIRRRKALAAELGIPMNALRVRVHRLRARLVAMMSTDRTSGRRTAAPAARGSVSQMTAPALVTEPATAFLDPAMAPHPAPAEPMRSVVRSTGQLPVLPPDDDPPETAGYATAAPSSPTGHAEPAGQSPPL